MKTVAFLALAIACSSVSIAQTPSTAPAASAAAPARPDPKDKVTCRTEEQIGSLLGGHRECHTRREWDEMAATGRAQVDAQTRMGNPVSHP